MLIIALVILLATLYFLIKNQYSYWEKEDIPHLERNIPFGNLKAVAKKEKSFGAAIHELYKQTTEPFVGIYLFFRPALLVRDVDLVRNILVKDFEHFADRGIFCDEVHDKFSGSLFALPGEKWKNLRQTLTPAFTSGKLKSMFNTLLNVGEKLKLHLDPLAENGGIIEAKSLAGRYVADVLGSVAFGIEANSINDPHDEFYATARKATEANSFLDSLRVTATFICPG